VIGGRFSIGAALLGASLASAPAAVDPTAPQASRMDFVPPAAGSYVLPRIQGCPDATLLDSSAKSVRLARETTGKITLLTFFYTYCADPWGCPFAYHTMTTLRERVMADPSVAGRVRFVSVSFDPTNDTPAALQRYGARFSDDPRLEWRFLTARNLDELLPVLDAFGQDVSIGTDLNGRPTRAINHMLKLFLIDRSGTVREIYSLAFVQPQVMLNDIRTLALEERKL
jgi:cytochrome oxidase Cu insertion factor (SCO1/SenC/PrrC family)